MMARKIPAWCSGEEWCPMTAASNLLGKKWHPVIVSILVDGPAGFNQLKNEVNGISSKVLSESLEDLQEKGLVDRKVVSEKPFRVNYSLTKAGEKLEPVLEELRSWAAEYLEESGKENSVI